MKFMFGQPNGSKPGVDLHFGVDDLFENPRFLVSCDRPCEFGGALVYSTRRASTPSNTTSISTKDHNPNAFIVVLGLQVLPSNLSVGISVMSSDNTPLNADLVKVDPWVQ
jgi:hypothetical protein